MSYDYYIYYRSNESAARVRAIVDGLFKALERDTGVRGRLLRRADDQTTWMEVYEGVDDATAFEQALARAVGDHSVRTLLAPGADRRIERFIEA